MSGTGAVSPAAQRNRYLAHTMRGRGVPLAVIASHLSVDMRSVSRYLAAPCPPSPAAEPKPDLSFRVRGACGNRPDIDWFSDNQARIAEAKKVCSTCPVLAQCRNYALAAGDLCGVWGGLTEGERRRQRLRRARGAA